MEPVNQIPELKPHPIQLVRIAVLNFRFNANKALGNNENHTMSTALKIRHSEFNEELKIISVDVKAEVGSLEENIPFLLECEIRGIFKVDTNIFPVEYIPKWAEGNAPLLLMPFLREQIYAASMRAGLSAVLLPLFEVPIFIKENNIKTTDP